MTGFALVIIINLFGTHPIFMYDEDWNKGALYFETKDECEIKANAIRTAVNALPKEDDYFIECFKLRGGKLQ